MTGRQGTSLVQFSCLNIIACDFVKIGGDGFAVYNTNSKWKLHKFAGCPTYPHQGLADPPKTENVGKHHVSEETSLITLMIMILTTSNMKRLVKTTSILIVATSSTSLPSWVLQERRSRQGRGRGAPSCPGLAASCIGSTFDIED